MGFPSGTAPTWRRGCPEGGARARGGGFLKISMPWSNRPKRRRICRLESNAGAVRSRINHLSEKWRSALSSAQACRCQLSFRPPTKGKAPRPIRSTTARRAEQGQERAARDVGGAHERESTGGGLWAARKSCWSWPARGSSIAKSRRLPD